MIFTRLAILLLFQLSFILILSLSRLAVYLGNRQRLAHAGPHNIRKAFGIGMRVDWIISGYLIIPMWLVICALPDNLFESTPVQVGLISWLGVVFTALVFGSIAEYFYFDEYGAKFNQIAIEYMRPGKGEISGMIWHDYPVVRAVLGVATVVGLLLLGSWWLTEWADRDANPSWELLLQTVLAAIWIVIGCRGLKHRPIGINFIEFTNSKMVNQLAANGYYQLIRIFYDEWHRGGRVGQLFKKLDVDKARERVQAIQQTPATSIPENPRNALDRVVTSPAPQQRPNVIMVLMESHAAAHIGALGSQRGVSPHFDQLAKEGLLFTRMYANGDRTARGIESVLCSLPPLPGVSTIKRQRSHGHTFTAASFFKDRGYETKFYYGGDASFDNMSGFMLSNGFESTFEMKDVQNPVWTTNWGHSDENVYDAVLADLATRTPDNPLYGFFLTISNHRPYTWPPGKIDPIYPDNEIESTFQYADFAMGQFIEKARKLPQWDNTVFVFVADHGSAVHGRSLVPVERFHIPLLILAPGIKGFEPRHVNTLASQVDVLPTLASLLGGECRYMGFGRDLLSIPENEGAALMHYYGAYAYIREDKALMMRPQQKPKLFEFDSKVTGGEVGEESTQDPRDLTNEALSYLTVAEDIYLAGKYYYPS